MTVFLCSFVVASRRRGHGTFVARRIFQIYAFTRIRFRGFLQNLDLLHQSHVLFQNRVIRYGFGRMQLDRLLQPFDIRLQELPLSGELDSRLEFLVVRHVHVLCDRSHVFNEKLLGIQKKIQYIYNI